MTYDHWKTADDTPGDEGPTKQDELEAVYADLARMGERLLRVNASNARLLAAARRIAFVHSDCRSDAMDSLKAAIVAEEQGK